MHPVTYINMHQVGLHPFRGEGEEVEGRPGEGADGRGSDQDVK